MYQRIAHERSDASGIGDGIAGSTRGRHSQRADDIAALAGMANDLAAQTAALHEKVNPAPATPAAPAS